MQGANVSRLPHNSASSRSSDSKVARLPQPITARATGSRKVENKKADKSKRHPPGHNNFGAITPAAPERENSGAAFWLTLPLARASVSDADPSIRHRQNLFDMATVSSAWPNQLEPDSLECSSTFRGLIQTFEEDGQSRPVAIAIFRARHTIR